MAKKALSKFEKDKLKKAAAKRKKEAAARKRKTAMKAKQKAAEVENVLVVTIRVSRAKLAKYNSLAVKVVLTK